MSKLFYSHHLIFRLLVGSMVSWPQSHHVLPTILSSCKTQLLLKTTLGLLDRETTPLLLTEISSILQNPLPSQPLDDTCLATLTLVVVLVSSRMFSQVSCVISSLVKSKTLVPLNSTPQCTSRLKCSSHDCHHGTALLTTHFQEL